MNIKKKIIALVILVMIVLGSISVVSAKEKDGGPSRSFSYINPIEITETTDTNIILE